MQGFRSFKLLSGVKCLAVLMAVLVTMECLPWDYPQYDFCQNDTELSFFHDKSGELSPNVALQLLRESNKTKSPQTINYGYTNGNVWIYLSTKKNIGLQKCSLDLANPQLDRIEIFHIEQDDPNNLNFIAQMGDEHQFGDRFLRVRNYVFPFKADQDQEFLLKIKSTATMTIPLKIQWRDQYISDSSLDYLVLGLFYGVMILFIFFGFHNYISFKERSFLLYSLFAISMLFFFIDRDGIAFQFLWPQATYWKLRSVRVFAAVTMGLGVFYYLDLLKIKSPFILITSIIYIIVSWMLALALVFIDPGKTNILTIIISIGSPLLMIFLPLSVWKRRPMFAPYLLAAGLCSFSGLIIYSLSVTNILKANGLTHNAMKFATISEFILLALGIHKRVKQTLRKKSLHKAVFDLSNMLAHDIRKPLDKLDKFIKRVGKVDQNKIEDYLRHSTESIRRDIKLADEMISDLVEIGRENKSTIEYTSLESVVKEVANGKFETNLQYKDKLFASYTGLKRIFDNLIKNALQATSNSDFSQYWITSKERGKFVEICVGNTGSKIERKDLQNVFEIFYTKGKKNGSGIGLAFVASESSKKGGYCFLESNGYRSDGKKVKRKYKEDYVEVYLILPKGNNHEEKALHIGH